ncbi:hypothetical protein GJ697_20030 [Pseudoduganella sp. FT25W]|jgi:hypothetical protein|uniref:Uncharacterized protein n=1 Tax=Duganella alba TaxID=2666081 RepID=A0A6L5QKB8_9BURK|nr:hypothetical protein [Duganella alba]MRX10130.1 hypothetical protein [Duganella alba]MRX16682.1 hypothetical protein [Duganella alba]
MNIATFEELLIAAALQPRQQRLLLTFAVAEPEPRSEAAQGLRPRTTLVPVMCVDKQVAELDTFENLADEAQRMGKEWDVLLVTTLSGTASQLPDNEQTDAALRKMIKAIRYGQMERLLAFDRSGDLLQYA